MWRIFIVLLNFNVLITMGQSNKPIDIHSFKILAINKNDTAKGTGFIINKDDNYFLITAKHVFFPSSTLKDYSMPNFEGSFKTVKILNQTDFSEIHNELIIDEKNKKLHYKTFNLDTMKSLDLAVLKLFNPDECIKQTAIPFSDLNNDCNISYKSNLKLEGFPSRKENHYSSVSHYYPKNIQILLDSASLYYFIIDIEEKMNGVSGGPIVEMNGEESLKIAGIFVGQNSLLPKFGYGIFAYYIRKTIEKFEISQN